MGRNCGAYEFKRGCLKLTAIRSTSTKTARQTASPVDGWAQLWHLTREKVISVVMFLLTENGQFHCATQ